MPGLIQHWRRFNSRDGLGIHALDKAAISSCIRSSDKRVIGSFINKNGFRSKKPNIFEFSLVPQPYCGNIKSARIYILLLNPGLSYTDVYGERRFRSLRSRLLLNLRQTFHQDDFPFIWLDPALCWHAGFVWWEQRLRALAEIIRQKRFEGRADGYELALRFLAKRIASIELVPYHSERLRLTADLRDIESVRLAKEFVQTYVARRAKAGKCLVLVFRQRGEWGLKGHTNVRTGKARGVRFSSFQKIMLKALDV